jgi:hypothetical protein
MDRLDKYFKCLAKARLYVAEYKLSSRFVLYVYACRYFECAAKIRFIYLSSRLP